MFLFGGFFLFTMLFVFALTIVPFAFAIYSLIEISRTPVEAFGPPWDNGKNAWTLGLALSFLLPVGAIVTSVLWWTQGHVALRAGRPVPRPFWSPSPTAPHYPSQYQEPPQP